jgi:imidazole glycerol-phosphate synthase subunit HisF
MIIPRVIPCLSLTASGLVKTVKFRNPKYVGDAINTMRIFNEKEVDEMIVLDITASLEKRKPNFSLIQDIATECFMPLGYGGGITSVEDIKRIFELGVEKVTLNSIVFDQPQLISEASRIFGSQSIIVSIDVKRNLFGKYSVFSHSGSIDRKIDPVAYAKQAESLGAGEIFLNSIDRDGTRLGYTLDVIEKVAGAVTIPVIVCGGANSLSDFRQALHSGASAAAAGSFFVLHGKHRAVLISYPTRQEINQLLSGVDHE